jgi:hypothetical protein
VLSLLEERPSEALLGLASQLAQAGEHKLRHGGRACKSGPRGNRRALP